MPILVGKSACFQPLSCVYSILVCQVAFELYCVSKLLSDHVGVLDNEDHPKLSKPKCCNVINVVEYIGMMFCTIYFHPESETDTASARSTRIPIIYLLGKYGIQR